MYNKNIYSHGMIYLSYESVHLIVIPALFLKMLFLQCQIYCTGTNKFYFKRFINSKIKNLIVIQKNNR